MTRALLLDLDDTLIVEEPAAVAAFAATARVAAGRVAVDAGALAVGLAVGVRARARGLARGRERLRCLAGPRPEPHRQ
jgi:hypothetical protein